MSFLATLLSLAHHAQTPGQAVQQAQPQIPQQQLTVQPVQNPTLLNTLTRQQNIPYSSIPYNPNSLSLTPDQQTYGINGLDYGSDAPNGTSFLNDNANQPQMRELPYQPLQKLPY